MEEKTYSTTINIHIHGGNNQILPNATKAEQHFYGTTENTLPFVRPLPSHSWAAEDESRLSLYITHKENLPGYIATLAACRTAREVGEAVVRLCADEPSVTPELIAKEKFIRVLLPFLDGVTKGKGIDNLRYHINEAWAAHKKNMQRRGILG